MNSTQPHEGAQTASALREGIAKGTILWLDDQRGEYEALRRKWPSEAQVGDKPWALEYEDLEDALACLDQWEPVSHPDVVLIDWSGGRALPLYERIRNRGWRVILVSWNRRTELWSQEAFAPHRQALGPWMLSKPFTVDQLMALVRRDMNERRPPTTGVVHAGGKYDPADMTGGMVPMRYLNHALEPVDCSSAWQGDINQPVITWTKQERNRLRNGESVTHTVLGVDPAGDIAEGQSAARMGWLQLNTRALPTFSGYEGGWPATAKYGQTAILVDEAFAPANADQHGSVADILDLMRQLGFPHGRYYRVESVPGISPNTSHVLELEARHPDRPELKPLPALLPMDEEELHLFRDYAKRRLDERDKLVFKIRETRPDPIPGTNDERWNEYVFIDQNTPNTLEVPIFYRGKSSGGSTPERSHINWVRGLFIFDKGNNESITKQQVEAISSPLMAALHFFDTARDREYRGLLEKQAGNLLKLQETLEKASNQAGLLNTVAEESLKFVQDIDGNKSGPAERSAHITLFDAFRRRLVVKGGAGVDGWSALTDLAFPLTCTRFVMVRAAQNALDALRLGKRSEPAYYPDYLKCSQEDRIHPEDWAAVEGMTDERREVCANWVQEKACSLVALPMVLDGRLLGVLTVRSDRAIEFTKRRVEVLERVITVAAPRLERLRLEANRALWDGLVMHEVRSNLTWAKSKMWKLAEAQEGVDREQARKELAFVLDDGVNLSTLFLHWLGQAEYISPAPTTIRNWQRLNEYGQFRAASTESKNWHWHWHAGERRLQATHAVLFERVLRILIDNSFRHASDEQACIHCDIEEAEAELSSIVVRISNPGELPAEPVPVPRSQESAAILGDFGPGSGKAQVGMTLARMICRETGAEVAWGQVGPQVIATLTWPSTKHTKGEENHE